MAGDASRRRVTIALREEGQLVALRNEPTETFAGRALRGIPSLGWQPGRFPRCRLDGGRRGVRCRATLVGTTRCGWLLGILRSGERLGQRRVTERRVVLTGRRVGASKTRRPWGRRHRFQRYHRGALGQAPNQPGRLLYCPDGCYAERLATLGGRAVAKQAVRGPAGLHFRADGDPRGRLGRAAGRARLMGGGALAARSPSRSCSGAVP